MTEQEFERHADEMWLLWRKRITLRAPSAKPTELEIWHAAYVMGVALGQQLSAQGASLPKSLGEA